MESSYVDSKIVKLVSETFIRPKFELPVHNEQPYYLGVIDLFMLSLHPMQKGLLFDSKPLHFHSFLDTLKRSLSLCLLHFYPLAGRFATEKYPEEHASWIYVVCSKGPGARVFHTTVDLAVSDILSSTDVHPIVTSFFDLGEMSVNYNGHTRPLVSIQVTELIDGVFVGFTMNHSVADGTSLWHFISSLSHIFLQLKDGQQSEEAISISKKPTYKPFFPEGFGPILRLPFLEPEEFVSRFVPGLLRERIFHFSSEAVSKLKAQAQAHKEAQKVSSFLALCAFLWKHVTKARNLKPAEKTHCSVIINNRFRIEPSIPETQFGNVVTPAETSCKVEEILGRELGWTAMLVHRAIAAQDDKSIRKFLDVFVKSPFVGQPGSESAFYMANSVLIAGSSKFDIYGPEFGLGRAVAVLPGYANKDDGKVIANPGREGRGSVDLEVCLKPSVMDALELDDEFMSFVS